ncbi:MAG: hypothetical protein R3Y63_15130 [Eubacteriales bacterium]
MHKLLSIDITLPILGETLHLMVPRNIMGSALLETVEELVKESFGLMPQGNLFFQEQGDLLDYTLALEELPFRQGLKLILM